MPAFGYRTPNNNRKFIPSGTPVEVIASFKKNGDFIPLYFRVTDEQSQERFTYKIDSISSIKDMYGVRIFKCFFINNNYKLSIELHFDKTNYRWVVGNC